MHAWAYRGEDPGTTLTHLRSTLLALTPGMNEALDWHQYKHEKEAWMANQEGSSVMHINVVGAMSLVSYALYLCVAKEVWSWPYAWLSEFLLLVVPLMLACTVLVPDPLSLLAGLSIPVCLWLLAQYIQGPPAATPRVSVVDMDQDDLPNDERDLLVGQALLNMNLTPSNSPILRERALPDMPEDDLASRRMSVFSLKSLPYMTASVKEKGTTSTKSTRYSFLTVYRAYLMILTVYCILAVDFPVFPRFFAKCETWGTSLVCDGA